MAQTQTSDTYLINPDGKLVTVSNDEVNKALGLGYRTATPDDHAVNDYILENKDLKGSVKVGIDQLLNQLAFNVPETIRDYSDTDLEKAKREALKKEHNIANIIGGVAGFAGSMAYGGPLTSAATGAVGKLIANRLGNAAIDAGVNLSAKAATTTGAGLASTIARTGAEGVLMAAPQAATEAYFKDYDQAAESLLAGGLIGGAVGGGLNLASKGLNKSAAASKWVGEKLGVRPTDNELAKMAKDQGLGEGDSLYEQIMKNVPSKDAPEIKAALGRMEIPEQPWMTSGNEILRGQVSSLAQSPSVPGAQISKEINSIVDRAKAEAESMLSEKAAITLKESGDEVQKKLAAEMIDRQASFQKKYEWVDDNLANVPFSEKVKNDIIKEITEDPHYKVSPTGIRKQIVGMVNNITDFSTAKAARQEISGLVGGSTTRGDIATISEINQLLKNKMGDAIDNLPDTFPNKIEAKKTWLSADAEYREGMQRFAPVDKALGGKKSKSYGEILDKVSSGVETGKFTEKLFNVSEISRLQTIKKDFPDIFEELKSQKMASIYAKSLTGQELNVKNFITQMEAIPAEVKKMMWGDGYAQKIADLKTVIYKALPKQIGPSGTPKGIDYQNILNVGLQVRDIGRYGLVKSNIGRSALPMIERGLRNVAKKLDQVDNVLIGKEVYKGPTGTQTITSGLSRLLHGHEDDHDHKQNFQKVSDKLSELNLNPQANQATIAFSSALSNNGAPQIAAIYQQQMQQALKYLYDMMPKDPNPPGVIKKKWHPNDAQLSKFNRIAKTVENPFSIMEDFQKGKLTKEQVDALTVVYPKFYNQVKNRVVKHAASNDLSKLSYNQKVQLGILLGTRDIDNSLTKLAAYQANFKTAAAQDGGMQSQMPTPKNYKFTHAEDTTSDVNRVMNRH